MDWNTATHYEVLQVLPSASDKVIRASWRALMQQHHPDKVPPEQRVEATAYCKRLTEAYEVLSDPARRAAYDAEIGANAGAPFATPSPDEQPHGAVEPELSVAKGSFDWRFWLLTIPAIALAIKVYGPVLGIVALLIIPLVWRRTGSALLTVGTGLTIFVAALFVSVAIRNAANSSSPVSPSGNSAQANGSAGTSPPSNQFDARNSVPSARPRTDEEWLTFEAENTPVNSFASNDRATQVYRHALRNFLSTHSDINNDAVKAERLGALLQSVCDRTKCAITYSAMFTQAYIELKSETAARRTEPTSYAPKASDPEPRRVNRITAAEADRIFAEDEKVSPAPYQPKTREPMGQIPVWPGSPAAPTPVENTP